MQQEMTGAAALAAALIEMGARRVYGIIGTSNLGFADALFDVRDRLRYISCRHEQVAASMADAEGRLSGIPGVVLVHSGPGALNAMISAGNAYKDCSPFIIISGAVKRKLAGSDGMLELDHLRVFAPVCKGTYRVTSASDVPEIFSRAYRAAMSGARGPVLIEVPEDVWLEVGPVDLEAIELAAEPSPRVDDSDVAGAVEMLKRASLPLVLAGGGVAYSRSSETLARFVEALGVPVATTGNGRGVLPETHPLALGRAGFGGGNLVADRALERADALLCLGCGISDMTTYEFTLPLGMTEITCVDISGHLAPQAPPARVVAADVGSFLERALSLLADEESPPRRTWDEALSEPRATWEAMCQASLDRDTEQPPGARVARWLSVNLPEDTIVSVGAGTHLLFAMDFIPCRAPLTFLSTVNFGSMGFGFAACMASKVLYPERSAIAVLGDGDFMMTLQDLETCVREGFAVKVFVINDRQYRVLNIRQMLSFGGRVIGTEHGNPDFAALARSFGAAGYTLDRAERIEEVLSSAVAEEGPVVVDVIIDPADLPPLNLEATLRMSAPAT
ncbi:MAG: thiamine pyrophosphate-binding protein [Actinobacteria bacterium]|nr:thiamine pyrophosphate-binding protein [Actinomycetota bacterium]MBU1944492.1 thiamine pyrophosphate-binding protein [Actinomycetota bacterium]MBU2688657.1 thiamine pyrophosphate-binding protein [Actinomycetota bacterium]